MIVLYVLGYFNRNKQNSYAALTAIQYNVSTLKPSIVTFNLYQGCWYIFKFGYSLGKNVEHGQFSQARRKGGKFYILPKKCVIC